MARDLIPASEFHLVGFRDNDYPLSDPDKPWTVIEISYGKIRGRRAFTSFKEAAKTAKTWSSQNAGIVMIR